MNYKDAYKGLRVMLTHPSKQYMLGRSNPAVGSKWECGGVINDLLEDKSIDVAWDNGSSNIYVSTDLSIEEETLDTIGRCVSIW